MVLVDPQRLEQVVLIVLVIAVEFAHPVGKCGPDFLRAALSELETLYEQMDRPLVYASLLHAAQTDDPRHGALLSRTQEQRTEINKHLIFFELEWSLLADGRAARFP